jgi:hypothetical protein
MVANVRRVAKLIMTGAETVARPVKNVAKQGLQHTNMFQASVLIAANFLVLASI